MEDVPEAGDFSLEDLITGDTSSLLTGEFGKQFGGSAMANVFTLLLVGVLMGLKKLCNRKSKCKSHLHCPCLDVDIVDQETNTIRTAPESTDGSGPAAV
jgi:hypothetical protein